MTKRRFKLSMAALGLLAAFFMALIALLLAPTLASANNLSTGSRRNLAHLPEGAKNFTTVELKSNFLGTVRDGTIRTECRAEHLGRTTQVWSCVVFAGGGRRIALFRCTQLVLW